MNLVGCCGPCSAAQRAPGWKHSSCVTPLFLSSRGLRCSVTSPLDSSFLWSCRDWISGAGSRWQKRLHSGHTPGSWTNDCYSDCQDGRLQSWSWSMPSRSMTQRGRLAFAQSGLAGSGLGESVGFPCPTCSSHLASSRSLSPCSSLRCFSCLISLNSTVFIRFWRAYRLGIQIFESD